MSKIKELLNDDEAVLVFDIDGVLAVMEWGEFNHYNESDEVWNDMYKEGSLFYTEEYVSPKMRKFLESRDKSRVFVITKAFNDYEVEDKRNFVNKYYGIPREHLYSVRNNFHKTDVIMEIKKMFPELSNKKIIMIDDTVEVLTDIMDRTGFSTAHVSSFLDL